MAGDHRRNAPEKRSGRRRVTSSVTPAVTGAAAGEAPAGTSASFSRMIGASVTGMSIRTVPATAGVKIFRRSAIRAARPNWMSDDAMISAASIPGPPCSRAETLTARNAAVLPMTRM